MGAKPKPITKAESALFGIQRLSKREALEDLEDLEREGLIRVDFKTNRLVPVLVLDRKPEMLS
jgi:hypothetical protein